MSDIDLDLFENLIDLESQFREFSDDLTLLNTDSNYVQIWDQFVSTNILPNLLNLIKFSKLMYSRYQDEYKKAEEETDKSKVIKKLAGTAEIHLQFIELLESYKLSSSLKSESNTLEAEVIAGQTFSDIISSYFENEKVRKHFAKFKDNLLDYNKFKNSDKLYQQIRLNMDQIKNEILVDTYQTRIKYILSGILPHLESIFDNWWLDDSLLLFSLNERCELLLNELKKSARGPLNPNVKSQLEKIDMLELNIASSQKFLYQAKFELKLVMLQLSKGEYLSGYEHLSQVIKTIEKIFLSLGAYTSGEKLKFINQTTENLYDHANLFSQITNVMMKYNKLTDTLKQGKFSITKKVCTEIKRLVGEDSSQIDLQYLSALPPVIDAIATSTDLMIDLNKDQEEIIRQNNQMMNKFVQRLDNALSQIMNKIKSFSDKNMEAYDLISSNLEKVKKDIELLKYPVYLLPVRIKGVEELRQRTQIAEHLVESIKYELMAFQKPDEYILIKLFLKSKSHYFAKLAYENMNNLDLVISRKITAHYSGSYISGNLLQIDIFKSIIQFICLTEVLPNFYMMLSQGSELIKRGDETLEKWENTLRSPSIFTDLIKEISIISTNLLEHKKMHDFSVSGVNWVKIKVRSQVCEGIIQFYEAIIQLLMSSLASSLDKKEEMLIFLDNSKKHAFESSNVLQDTSKLGLDLQKIPSMIFELGKFSQNAQNNPDTFSLDNTSVSSIFKIIRDLVFAI